MGIAAERRETEERTRRERFDRCVARGAAFLAANPAACPMYALLVEVLFPEVGIVDVNDRRQFSGGDDGVSDETLDRLVRLVVAVYRDPRSPTAAAAATDQRAFHIRSDGDRLVHRCAHILTHTPSATVGGQRELLRSFLLQMQIPAPVAVPAEVIVISDSDSENEADDGKVEAIDDDDDDGDDLDLDLDPVLAGDDDVVAMDDDDDGGDKRDAGNLPEEDDDPVAPPVGPAPAPAPHRPRVRHDNPAIRRRVGVRAPPSSSSVQPARPQRPAVKAAIWYETLVAAEHFGGLFVGGPDGCVWTLRVIPLLYGKFNGPVLVRSNQYQNDRNVELLQLLAQALGPKLTVLGPEDTVIVDIMQNEATSRRAINRIGRFLMTPRMGPEHRPLTVPEIQDVMVRNVIRAVAEQQNRPALRLTTSTYVPPPTPPHPVPIRVFRISGGARPDWRRWPLPPPTPSLQTMSDRTLNYPFYPFHADHLTVVKGHTLAASPLLPSLHNLKKNILHPFYCCTRIESESTLCIFSGLSVALDDGRRGGWKEGRVWGLNNRFFWIVDW
jgi:hypothetical protein